MKIKKAILPVAGFGTRFLPATKAQPKEMLPIFDTPAIQFIVEELVAAGISEIIFVTGKSKRAIEDHFDSNFELEKILEKRGKIAELNLVQKISRLAKFAFVRQHEQLGDGHAILCARHLVAKNEPVVVCFGDDITDNPRGKNSIQQLLEIFAEKKSPVILCEKVEKSETKKYGILDFAEKNLQKNFAEIKKIVEKPAPELAPSNFAAIGKYILTPEIFDFLEKISPAKNGEIQLSAAFSAFLKNDRKIFARILDGHRFDIGDKIGFLQATIYFAAKKFPEIAGKFLKNEI